MKHLEYFNKLNEAILHDLDNVPKVGSKVIGVLRNEHSDELIVLIEGGVSIFMHGTFDNEDIPMYKYLYGDENDVKNISINGGEPISRVELLKNPENYIKNGKFN